MAWWRKRCIPTSRRTRRGSATYFLITISLAVISANPTDLIAQQASSVVYQAGNAAVTGFSGALPPAQIAPGDDPDEQTFIDLNGPSLRVIDLQHMGGPAIAQLVSVPKPFTFTATSIGQVFGVAIDDQSPPNIYAAATSVYGLPIVTPGPNGRPLHVRVGAPDAKFMPGLWGARGGPGSIWKIDGATGTVSLFANVTLDGRSNSGAALGGLAYDPESKSLFVVDRETGFIHRFDLNGRELGRYDHGVSGRAAQGLAPVEWNSPHGIDVTSPQFDSTQPATWNYAAPERRIFGLAIHERRLYYAVADSLQIWSVGLGLDGSFGADAVIELAVPPADGPTEISKITFDEQGRMFVADRPAPTGAFNFEVLSAPAIGRVLRYAAVSTMANGRRIWQSKPDEYAIGFPGVFRNGNGGVAIGYNYDRHGQLVLGSCGGFMWTTGEDLRHPTDARIARLLGRSGPLDVDGLQGNGTWQIKVDDRPPFASYFIDYSDEFGDEAARGHIGDIEIERLCSPAQPAGLLPFGGLPPFGGPAAPPSGAPPPTGNPPGAPPPSPPPGGACPPDQLRRAGTGECGSCPRPGIQIGGTCCSVSQLAANAACSNSSCPSGQTPIGPSNFCCNSSQVYAGAGGGLACCSGPVVNGQCSTSTPTPTPIPPVTCAKGYVSSGNGCCLASQMTSTGTCCPIGQLPSGLNKGQCRPIHRIPIGPRCCQSGIPTASGQCCPPANVTTSGVCCSGPVDPNNRQQCQVPLLLAACRPGYTKMPDGTCCNNRFVSADGKSCNVSRQLCPPGEFRDERGVCIPVPSIACPPGQFRAGTGECRPIPSATCPPGEVRSERGVCVRAKSATCPPGEVRNERGVCVRAKSATCPPGEVRSRRGVCVRVKPLPPVAAPSRPRRPIVLPGGPILRGPPGKPPLGREQ